MSQLPQLPRWFTLVIIALSATVALRYVAAVQSGVDHTVAIRTYLFWALTCAPVAYLTDVIVRTAAEYRVVQLAVARVKSRR